MPCHSRAGGNPETCCVYVDPRPRPDRGQALRGGDILRIASGSRRQVPGLQRPAARAGLLIPENLGTTTLAGPLCLLCRQPLLLAMLLDVLQIRLHSPVVRPLIVHECMYGVPCTDTHRKSSRTRRSSPSNTAGTCTVPPSHPPGRSGTHRNPSPRNPRNKARTRHIVSSSLWLPLYHMEVFSFPSNPLLGSVHQP